MSATDELRRLLDERGVEHTDAEDGHTKHTWWSDGDHEIAACDSGERLAVYDLTPEQAVEATLGSEGYSYGQWREISNAVGDAMEYAHDKAIECPDKADPLWNLDEYVNRILKVAFEGEAMLGRGTCEVVGSIRHDYEGGYGGTEYEHELSCGHKTWWADDDPPDYCPWCGRKVVDA